MIPKSASASQSEPGPKKRSATISVTNSLIAADLQDPSTIFGDLFSTVQLRRIFADGKHFPDMNPRSSPEEILSAWHVARPESDQSISDFVKHHFTPPDSIDASPAAPADSVADHITAMWDQLVRSDAKTPPCSSALWLPRPYLVPGGRFRETYYWDSYFSMLGLCADGRADLVEAMIENFVSLVERFGHIPNGSRSYFTSRSQPPFLAQMLELSTEADRTDRQRRLQALRTEHAYWMSGTAEARTSGSGKHVVEMPDGSYLNRYWDEKSSPRPESYAEDVETARASTRAEGEVYRDLRAGAESGWDFSSRWLTDGRTLASIQTTSIVPCDLNSLLYGAERKLAKECRRFGLDAEAMHYDLAADQRRASINRYLWVSAEGRFADWHFPSARITPGVSAATLYPLYVGLACLDQATAVACTVRASLLAPGGLRTTTTYSGEQWDAPNGWAPLQWIACEGLRLNGGGALANEIADRWIDTVEHSFAATGMLFEKYDVERRQPGAGGEYPNQTGFGWTNGVTQALLADRRR